MTKQSIFFFMLFMSMQLIFAQEENKKHTVKKGESITQIAQNYYVTPYDIFKLNPEASDGIEEGMVLTIPKAKVTKQEIVNQNSSNSQNNSFTYRVKPGETKYSLAKRFGLTVAQLESQNPQIVPTLIAGEMLTIKSKLSIDDIPSEPTTYVVKAGDTKYSLAKKYGISIRQLENLNPETKNMLVVGQVLNFSETPTKSTMVETKVEPVNTKVVENNPPKEIKEKPVPANPNVIKDSEPKIENSTDNSSSGEYVNYTIKPQQTLYGLSNEARMSIPEFLKLNPKLKNGVIVGDVIKMPKSESINYETVEDNKLVSKVLPPKNVRYDDLTLSLDKSKTLDLVFYLPFNEYDFSVLSAKSTKDNDSIKQWNVEFYKGAKIALDSLNKLGITMSSSIIETSNNLDNINTKAVSRKLKSIKEGSLIFAPYINEENYNLLNDNVDTSSSPIILVNGQDNMRNTIQPIPSNNSLIITMLNYLKNKNGNVIVIHDDSTASDNDQIKSILDSAKFLPIKNSGIVENNQLISNLVKGRKNYVLINTKNKSAYLSSTTALLSESSNYNIQLAVLNKELLPNETEVSRMRFRVLNLLYPSLVPSTENPATKIINDKLKGSQTGFSSLSRKSFDMVFDTALRQSQPKSPDYKSITEHSSIKFEYKNTTGNNLINYGAYILKFDNVSDNSEAE